MDLMCFAISANIVYFCTFDTFSVLFVAWHRLNYMKFLQECIFELKCTTASKYNFRQKSYIFDYSSLLPESSYFCLLNHQKSTCLERFGPSNWDVTTSLVPKISNSKKPSWVGGPCRYFDRIYIRKWRRNGFYHT